MFCSNCGAPDQSGKFCSACGQARQANDASYETDEDEIPSRSKKQQLASINKFAENTNLICLDCGYEGLAGIVRINKTKRIVYVWAVIVPVLILSVAWAFLFGGLGFIGSFIFGMVLFLPLRFIRQDVYVECPNCLHIVGPLR